MQTEPAGPPGGRITDVAGIRVGHHTDRTNGTGCTVVLCDERAAAGIEVRGAAPGSRDTEMLHPLASADWVNGVMLSGGSLFGLDAAAGATRFLEERGTGLRVGRAVIPLVPSAILFDLGLITHEVRPTADDGYAACQAAGRDFALGSVGAGTGATVGKLRGMERAVKGGIGTAAVRVAGGPVVGALMAVNAGGSIVDPASGLIIAGPRTGDADSPFEDSLEILVNEVIKYRGFFTNTVIGVVATDATLDKRGAARVAVAGQDGIALAVRPAHTSSDGDTVFALATGGRRERVNPDALHAAALRAASAAVLSAVRNATGLGGVPSAGEVLSGG